MKRRPLMCDVTRKQFNRHCFMLSKIQFKFLLKYIKIRSLILRSQKLSNVGRSSDGCPKIYYLKLLRASEGTLSHWSRLHLQTLAPTNQHWVRVVRYGLFSLCVIHKEGLCPSSGDINKLIMMKMR
jgi:hypothetical protein